MTVVNISGTFSKDQRPNNGLDAIADKIKGDHFLRVAVTGIVEFHSYHDVMGRPESITVRFAALEPQFGDADDQTRQMLDQARKARGLGQVELTLFDETSSPDAERDPTAGPWPGDAGYEPPTDQAETATTAGEDDDGPTSERTPDVWLEDGSSGTAAAPKSRRRKPPATSDGQ